MIATILMLSCSSWAGSDDQKTFDTQRADKLVIAARARTKIAVRYDPAYRRLTYPNGDVPNHLGVCTDVVIRAYRAIGIDLQQRVHEDMARRFIDYPDRWGQKKPDSNIDHRRVPNLETFFARHGSSLSTSSDSEYLPGDIVTWRLPHGAPHIGIIDGARSVDNKRPLVIHNIGSGPKIEDVLFDYKIVGHFRYLPKTI